MTYAMYAARQRYRWTPTVHGHEIRWETCRLHGGLNLTSPGKDEVWTFDSPSLGEALVTVLDQLLRSCSSCRLRAQRT